MKNINEIDFEIPEPEDRDDFILKAIEYDEICVSVGGLAVDLGMF